MIEIDDVSVSFGDATVLNSISLSIDDGRFVGLVGPNGSGKTTLLRTTSGALAPSEGAVYVDGLDVHARSSRASSQLVSVVPQDTSVAFSFDVRHVIEMGRTPYRSRFAPPDEADHVAVADAMDRTQTTYLADRPIDELSGGERQRVVLARALAQETPVILLDEPTASLDVNHQVEILTLVEDLAAGGTTVVAAIHDLDLAARFCDELVVLADGRILERGPPTAVLKAETIEAAFDATGVVSRNPVTRTPSVTTLPSAADDSVPDRVHVVGTGGHTATILSRLAATESTISLGPVPTDDAAAVTASHLGVETHTTDPFSELGERQREYLHRTLADVDAVVLVPGGPLDSSELVWRSVRSVPTVVVDTATASAERPRPIANSLEHLRNTSLQTDPDSVLSALASLEGGSSATPGLDTTQSG